MNHLIHIAAISQIRLDADGRLLPAQKSRRQEAPRSDQMPQAKVSDAIYHQLLHDAT
jgi:hypothetical protein